MAKSIVDLPIYSLKFIDDFCDSPMKLVIFQFAKSSYVQLPEGESLPYFIFHQNERCTKFLVGRYLGPQAEWDHDRSFEADSKIPSGKHTKNYWKWQFIVSFPIEHGDFMWFYVIFHSSDSLPAGIPKYSTWPMNPTSRRLNYADCLGWSLKGRQKLSVVDGHCCFTNPKREDSSLDFCVLDCFWDLMIGCDATWTADRHRQVLVWRIFTTAWVQPPKTRTT